MSNYTDYERRVADGPGLRELQQVHVHRFDEETSQPMPEPKIDFSALTIDELRLLKRGCEQPGYGIQNRFVRKSMAPILVSFLTGEITKAAIARAVDAEIAERINKEGE